MRNTTSVFVVFNASKSSAGTSSSRNKERIVAVMALLGTRISDLPLTQRPLHQEIALEMRPSF